MPSTPAFSAPPDPGRAGTLDDLAGCLRALKVWAGDVSYETITARVNAAWTAAGRPPGELTRRTTVADCFRPGRRRLNPDLVAAVAAALHPDPGYATQWQQALRVVGGETAAAAQVRVQDRLPQPFAEFTGRAGVLHRLRAAVRRRPGTFAIVGMAGVGKTLLAVQAGHLLSQDQPFDRVLFVNLRGFHPDPAQPPADPAAVLDGFLRLLGVPGHRVPHDLPGRGDALRERLTGLRSLIVLDNAADAEQARPLVPAVDGCVTLVTSRRALHGLPAVTDVPVDVFTPQEAVHFLTAAAPGVPAGRDPDATARVAARCGHLPLALGLVGGHIRAKPGWTMTDHAERLDERHRDRRLDSGVELALALSYQDLPADRQRLLRLVALHPGQDFDVAAAAALAGDGDLASPAGDDLSAAALAGDGDLAAAGVGGAAGAGDRLEAAGRGLRELRRDHLLQETTPGRYTLHDLVRVYAAGRAGDEDAPPARRAALTRLFDHYLGAAAAAMDVLAPAEAHLRPRVAAPADPPGGVDAARAWLDTERSNLVAVAGHTAVHGWHRHTTALSATLAGYLNGGHHGDALSVHGQAHRAACHAGDVPGQAAALTALGATRLRLGDDGPAARHLREALQLYRRAGDRAGQARASAALGDVEQRLGRYRQAAYWHRQALRLYRLTGDPTGEAHALTKLGIVEERLGRYRAAAGRHEQALALFLAAGDRTGEAAARCNLGDVTARLGDPDRAAAHLRRALDLYREAGNRDGEAWTLDNLGTAATLRGAPAQALELHRRALVIHRATGERYGEAKALNGLGEAARSTGDPAAALAHHTAARAVAAATGDRHQRADAETGIGLALPGGGLPHLRTALTLYEDLGVPDADRLRALLAAHDDA
ncbi:tetratricopeptide repeat protein [Dactylosporangium aurantiacum]|uniref:Tetratricopeptide repeat protein n=1 Tax=Dactylosporangium aurantiacum TaxID=35754 RepID=A0A9Q9IME8_9ACTN|nr:tetratricopeptide repeat protein [Dactylosporangium aurantiacum]MDG6103107.1 tetratricopeptide repeat protein [Dactylosporangium aurantiacum]UWZ57618.1 tetratricopeptide repeat protein [Dactylosporangium aurantiacum]